jgi:hypothetical protein
MKSNDGLNDLAVFAAAAILYTTIAMWAAQPASLCKMSEQSPGRLYLDRQVHREHLARDARRMYQLARRYAASAGHTATEQAKGAEQCLESLSHDLAEAHAVPIDHVREVIAVER